MRVENWCGYDIRFVKKDNDWWAVLKDICDALDLRTDKVASRLDPNTLSRTAINVSSDNPSKVNRSKGHNKYRQMLIVNELGIYDALFSSRKLEAKKFRAWAIVVMQKLRKSAGLQGYEALRMTDKNIQDSIDDILDTLYWDEEKQCVMQSITIQGGDVEQIPFE